MRQASYLAFVDMQLRFSVATLKTREFLVC